MKRFYSLLFIAVLLCSCNPTKRVSVSRNLPSLPPDAPVTVYPLSESMPEGAITLGTVKIGDSGFSTNCTYDAVIMRAMEMAREAGGNALKITEHRTPSFWTSTCHRITASIISVPEDILLNRQDRVSAVIDEALLEEGCAMIHLYRFSGAGAAINYNVMIDDEVLARMRNNYRESVKVKADGQVTLLARTEARSEVGLDLQPGRHYYVRCSLTMGFAVGHPKLELVDEETGTAEFNSMRDR